jgi:hypothetical protein
MDLAKAHEICLKPVVEGWNAYKLRDETVVVTDSLASKAICLCLLAGTTQPETSESILS